MMGLTVVKPKQPFFQIFLEIFLVVCSLKVESWISRSMHHTHNKNIKLSKNMKILNFATIGTCHAITAAVLTCLLGGNK
jgi:hypothetical protein